MELFRKSEITKLARVFKQLQNLRLCARCGYGGRNSQRQPKGSGGKTQSRTATVAKMTCFLAHRGRACASREIYKLIMLQKYFHRPYASEICSQRQLSFPEQRRTGRDKRRRPALTPLRPFVAVEHIQALPPRLFAGPAQRPLNATHLHRLLHRAEAVEGPDYPMHRQCPKKPPQRLLRGLSGFAPTSAGSHGRA